MKKSITYLVITLLVLTGSNTAAGNRLYPDSLISNSETAGDRHYPVTAGDRHYPDSLFSYLETAATNNPLVMQKLKEYQASLRQIPQAGSLPDPELSAGIFLMPMELVGGRQYAELKLMQMFPWFGVLRNARDEMSLMANSRYEEFRKTKLMIYYEVQSTWYELYKIRKEISVTRENVDILNSIEQVALARFRASPEPLAQTPIQGSLRSGSGRSVDPAGSTATMTQAAPGSQVSMGLTGLQSGTGTTAVSGGGGGMQMKDVSSGTMGAMVNNTGSGLADLYRIQIEAAELKNSVELLRNREKTMIARFNSLLNRPPHMTVHTIEEARTDTPVLPFTVLPDSIDARSPVLAMLDFEIKAWEARERMATGMGLPMTGLGVSYAAIGRSDMSTSEMNGRDMIMPMISITLPIYRKKYRAMREEAELMQEAAMLSRQAAANSLQNDYYEALQMYNDAQRRKELYETQYTLASRSLELTLKGYSAATADLTDVLRIQQQALGYNLDKVRAVTDVNIAVARLNQLMASELTFQSSVNDANMRIE